VYDQPKIVFPPVQYTFNEYGISSEYLEDTYEVYFFNIPLIFPRTRERFYLLRDPSHSIIFRREGDDHSVDIDPYSIILEASMSDLIAVHNHPDDCRIPEEVYRPSPPDRRMVNMLNGEPDSSELYTPNYRLHHKGSLGRIRHILVTRRFGWCEYNSQGVTRKGTNRIDESL